MGLTLSSFALCSNCFGLSLPDNVVRDRKKKDISPRRHLIAEIINDINSVMVSYSDVETTQILNQVLHRLVRYTQSDYGFIGKVSSDGHTINTIVSSSSVWDVSSHLFYVQHFRTNISHKSSLMLNNKTETHNHVNSKEYKFPSGHPIVKRFMVVPSLVKPEGIQIVIVLVNRCTKYTQPLVEELKPVADVLSYLFLRLSLD